RSDPVAEHGGETWVWSGTELATNLVGKSVARLAVPADSHGANLFKVPRDGCLRDLETFCGEPVGELLLTGEGPSADQVCQCVLAPFFQVGHRMLMHLLACLCNHVDRVPP